LKGKNMRKSVVNRVLQMACSGLLLSSAVGCAHHGCHKSAHAGAGAHGGIVVSGTGEAQGSPDLARSSVGIEVRAPSVQEATQQANAQMANLLRALKEQGIAESDLRTHGFSVSFDREYRPPQPMIMESAPAVAPTAAAKPARKGPAAPAVESAPAQPPEVAAPRGSYVVSNMVEVTIRKVDKLGDVLSAATAAGANNVWGINFDVSDKRPLVERARAQAFENARADAQRLAELSGVKLGKLTQVNDGVGGPSNGPVMGYGRLAAQDSVPVERGELTITHQVELHYAIERGDEHHHDAPHDAAKQKP
jgi:uncharacterized protein YggE